MILGLDIDGCLNDSEWFNYVTLQEFSDQIKHIKLAPNFIQLHHFGLPDDLYQEYMNLYFPLMVKTIQPRPFVKEYLFDLRFRGHEIKIITARDEFRDIPDEPYKGYMMKRDTLRWFDKHEIPYDKIIFSANKGDSDKGIVCSNENIDIMLEDDVKNIEKIVERGIRCIIMENSNNDDYTHPLTQHIQNMSGYYHVIRSCEVNM